MRLTKKILLFHSIAFLIIAATCSVALNAPADRDAGAISTIAHHYDLGSSEPPIIEWNKTFGGAKDDWAGSVFQTDDEGYIIGGGTSSLGAGGYDIWLIGIDSAGSERWNKTIGDIAEDGEGFGTIRPTTDGGCVFTASFCDVVNGTAVSKKFWLFKTNSVGDLQWKKTDVGSVVELTNEGGYVLAGSKWVNLSFDFQLVKMNEAGDVQWEKTFGGDMHEEARSVQRTNDGGYIIVGTIGNLFSDPFGWQDVWLVKTDSTGNMQWNRTYDGGGREFVSCVRQTYDNGYVFVSDNWLVRTDPIGNQLWNRTFGGYAEWIEQTKDGGYIVAGESGGDFLLTKIGSSGDQVWTKICGGSGEDWAYSVQQTTDGGYVAVGYTGSFGAGDRDVWVVKLAGEPLLREIWVPDEYEKIQWAVDNASYGDTIRVRSGTYFENVVVNKSVSLIGEDPSTTVIDGGGIGDVVCVTTGNVAIKDFKIRNSGSYYAPPNSGIRMEANYCNITNNNVIDNSVGIYLNQSSYNKISSNNVTNRYEGITLHDSSNNVISGNNIMANSPNEGIFLIYSSNNEISRNNIMANNASGICLTWSSSNDIYHNDFVDNTEQVESYNSTNVWGDGYPSGGNYWSDYVGADLKKTIYQNESGSDGIGDMPYSIDGNDQDDFPLIGPISVFDAGLWNDITYYVNIVSNSTLSHFHFDPDEGAFVSFWVKGENETETQGFCRVAIPKNLLWVEDGWDIYYGSVRMDYSLITDYNCTYLYFTYTNPGLNSFTTVTINGTHVIPEFPSFLFLPLFIVATLLTAIAFRRKRAVQD